MVAGSLGIRQGDITREIDARYIGSVCLFCGNKQDKKTAPLRHFFPVEWSLEFRGIEKMDDSAEVVRQGSTPELSLTRGDRLEILYDYMPAETGPASMISQPDPNP